MKLFLASEAKHPESMAKLKKFVGGFKNKKIVYIPTAANGEGYGCWKNGASIQIAKSLGANLEIIELENFTNKNIVETIGQPDILWVAGGATGYLSYWLRRVELDKTLPSILNNRAIYVGSSAGSVICAKTLYSAEWFLGEPEPGVSIYPGLGFTDFEIYPHYQEIRKTEIEKNWQKGELWLIKNGEAITIVDNEIKVLGEKRVIKL